MKNRFTDTQPYTPQKLSMRTDAKIRMRLFGMFLQKVFGASRLPQRTLALGLVFAILVITFVPHQISLFQLNSFVAKAEAAQLNLYERSQHEIFHRLFVVKEGSGKIAFVAKSANIPLNEIEKVALRHDKVEQWSLGISNLSYIETDVSGRPITVKLNLENKDHMHIFEYAPSSCAAQERDGITTPECTQKAEATKPYLAHRSTFDGVHDLKSLYNKEVAYNPNPQPLTNFTTLTHVGRVSESGKTYETFSSIKDGIETRYYFDTETYLLKKRIITIIDGDTRYEMSEIEELEYSFLPADSKSEIFNPKGYPFVQKEVIPL